jgi:predicted fused transcriptional regulator/phosphomethylpyrimidine kinase
MPEMLNVSYKRRAIRAAKELGYGKKVVDKLKKATSDNEITRIMYSARNAEWSEKSGE